MGYPNYNNLSDLFTLIGDKLRDNEWMSLHRYKEGEFIIYDDKLYRAKEDFISGNSFDTTHLQTLSYTTNVPSTDADDWASGKHYYVSDLVKYSDQFYICIEEHTSGSDFLSDYTSNYWKQLDINLVVSGNTGYVQFNCDVTSTPYIVYLPIKKTRDFCLPPPSILREANSTTNLVDILNYDSGEASKFSYDVNYVDFDGKLHLKKKYAINFNTPQSCGSGYISESDYINFNNYRNISNLSVNSIKIDESDVLFNIKTQGNNIIDTVNNVWTVDDGNVSVDTSELSPIGNYPIKCQNNASYTTLTPKNNMDFLFTSTDDFTIAFWCKIDQSATRYYATFMNGRRARGYQRFEGLWDIYAGTGHSPAWVSSTGSSSYVSGNKSNADLVDIWHHYALVKRGNTFYVFVDGELCGTGSNYNNEDVDFGYRSGITIFGEGNGDNNAYCPGLYDDFIFVKRALWLSDFDVPTDYLCSYGIPVYISNNEAYGMDSSDNFIKLSSNWSSLSDSQKESIFLSLGDATPSISDLSSLNMPIKIVKYTQNDAQQRGTMVALPLTGQCIIPTELIDLTLYQKLKAITFTSSLSGNALLKLLVTTDLSTYKKFDSSTLSWIDVNINNIATDGNSISDINNLTESDIEKLNAEESGIAFAYYLNIDTINDSVDIDKLQMNLKFFGELIGMGLGSYYNYFNFSYPAGNILKVTINSSGSYKINYCPGS